MSGARVAVVMGGRSSEHEVSLRSGQQVLAALEGQHPLPVVISREGRWTVDGVSLPVGQAVDRLRHEIDVVFLALHGAFGEDGTIQGLFEMVGLAYTGSDVLGSALAMDKVRTKLVYRASGLPTPDFVAMTPTTSRAEARAEAERRLGFPSVVKVARSGSSTGVKFAKNPAELEAIVDEFMGSTELVLVERFVRGRELTCGVLDHVDGPRALPPTEIVPTEGFAFFDYVAKYTPGATQEITPARFDAETTQEIQRLAVEAHRALGCRDMSRTDMIIGDDGCVMLIETNTIPGFTAQSLLPQAAEAAGMSFPALVAHLVERARARGVR
jgi:D-alanine-D-alanine ligase